ncbi:hypothetical protein PTKIN_Ptkin09bG0167600 [Pterospermum kingtungense]
MLFFWVYSWYSSSNFQNIYGVRRNESLVPEAQLTVDYNQTLSNRSALISGFAWNPTTKMFDAEMDVWQQLIQEKPQARKWMHMSVDNYDKLLELFGEQRATGQYAESAREKVARWQMEGCSSQIDLNDSMDSYMMSDSEGIMGNDFSNAENVNSPENAPSINSQGTSSSRGRKRKASMMEMLAKQYEKLNTNIERVSEVLDRGNVIAENGNMIAEKSLSIIESGRPQFYKPEEIYAEVELIGSEMGEDFVINAYNYLSNNASATRSFFGLPRDKRFGWLFRLVGTI